MTPAQLQAYLNCLVKSQLPISTMIWGAPGIGKSSIVAQVARQHQFDFVDVRLSQLAPTDLRGLPVAEDGISKWYPPEFLPRGGKGILFLDELNQSPPAMQGIAQQLVLDRRIGSYCYDDRTRVMTRNGLKLFQQLSNDDEVMTLNPDLDRIEYHKPSRLHILDYQGEMLHFTSKTISLCVSPDHRMYVRAKEQHEYQFIDADELSKRKALQRYVVKRGGDWFDESTTSQFILPECTIALNNIQRRQNIRQLHSEGLTASQIASKSGLSMVTIKHHLYAKTDARKVVRYSHPLVFDMGEWAEFMGWFVTEGSAFKCADGSVVTLGQDPSVNRENWQRIRALLAKMGFKFSLNGKNGNSQFVIYSQPLYEYLSKLGKTEQKFIPDNIKNLPKRYLRRFFDAALAGDGTKMNGRSARLTTVSERLKDDYCEIGIKLGYGVSYRYKMSSGNSRPGLFHWVINFNGSFSENQLNQVERLPYNGKIYCITVPNHIIMVERDGNLAWCGNCVPDDWFVWAAGNRKEDRASVFDMPAPLANRFLHLSVEPDFESFKAYALAANLHEQVIAFLSFRTSLLHKLDPHQPAWPSPRSWEMASRLHRVGLDVTPAVGEGAAAEFVAYCQLYANLPDLEPIFQGIAGDLAFPAEPSVRYATTIGLAMRAANAQQGYCAFSWLSEKATPEWVQLFAIDLFRTLRSKGKLGELAILVQKDPKLQQFLKEFQKLVIS